MKLGVSGEYYVTEIGAKITFWNIGRVVQLDRISDFGSEGWGFESSRGHYKHKALQRKLQGFLFPKTMQSLLWHCVRKQKVAL